MTETRPQTDNGSHPPTTAEDMLARYSAGERNFSKADLPEGSDLRGVILAGAEPAGAKLADVATDGAIYYGAAIDDIRNLLE